MEPEMSYPKEFKERARKIFPYRWELHEMIEEGLGEKVGEYLKRNSTDSLPLNSILNAKSFEEIQKKAEKEADKFNLYKWWEMLHRKQNYNR